MKKRSTKALSIILAALVILLCIPGFAAQASAAEAQKITIVSEPSWRCSELYYSVMDNLPGYDQGMVFVSGDYWITDFTWFILGDGRIGYCVQPYKGGVVGEYSPNPGAWAALSDQRQQGVGLAFLYGAPNNGKSSDADYVATCAVVRDMACGYRMPSTAFTKNGSNGQQITESPFGKKLQQEYPVAYDIYLDIIADIAKHGTIPSFTSKKKSEAPTIMLQMNTATGLYEAIATDTNGVLDHFNYTSNIAGLTFTRNGNTLNIKATEDAAKQLTSGVSITSRGYEFEQPQDVCSVWTSDPTASDGGIHQLVAVMDAQTDPVRSYFNIAVEAEQADVNVQKTSDDNNVEGISFSVLNNTTGESATYTTDAEGKFSIRVTVGDSLTITETVPAGYYNETASQTITVAEGTNSVTFSNTVIQGQITVEKKGEVFYSVTQNGNTYQPVYAEGSLPGAVFEIRAAEDIYAPEGTKVLSAGDLADTVTTGADGKATSKNLYLGKYTVTETTAPNGMVINATAHDVVLTEADPSAAVVTASVTVTNERQKAEVSLTKIFETDEDYGIAAEDLTDVVFGLYAEEVITAADGNFIPADGLLERAACAADGTLTFQTDIPYGAKLYVREISTNEKYLVSEEKFSVIFDEEDQTKAEVTIEVNAGDEILNELIRGEIEGKKVNENGEPLANAKFGLFLANETTFTEEKAICIATSGIDGIFKFQDVPYGTYIIKELEAPAGYVLKEDKFEVTIDEDSKKVELTVENKQIQGSLEITKTDVSTGEVLPNAEFRIRNEAGEIVAEGKTNEKGVATFELPAGKYTYQEFVAPEGYQIDSREFPFEIKEDGEVIKATMTNTPKTVSPATGDYTNLTIPATIFALSVLILAVMLYQRQKRFL